MKKTTVSRALFLVMVLLALAASPAAQGPNTVPRNVTGVLNGTFTFEQWGSEWWEIYTNGEATGTVQHLGLSTLYTRHTPTVSGDLVDGTFEIVAANGDELRGTYDGFAAATSNTFLAYAGEATLVITGGTGRFAGATGTIDATFLETFTDYSYALAVTRWTLAGTVNY